MDLVTVRARDCACPNTPHDGDTVDLLAKPSLALGLAAHSDMNATIDPAGVVDGAKLKERWFQTYLRLGAVGWNLTDDDGSAVPFNVDELLADYAFAYPVAEKADELYSEAILRPLLERLSAISRNGQTAASTSPRATSIRSRRKSSSPEPSVVSRPLDA